MSEPKAGGTAWSGEPPASPRGARVPGRAGEQGVVLRLMSLRDVSTVSVLEQALFGVEAWSPEMLAGELTADPGSRYYLVAEDDGVITGYGGLLAQAGGQADVLTLAVAAGRWGEGIGSALLDGLLAEAARRGCAEIFLEVRVDNDRAQRLYRRRGFTDVGIRRGYYQPSNTDALVMRLVTAAPDRRARLRGKYRAAKTPAARDGSARKRSTE